MERIGIAASKMAKGNLFVYNFYVILLSFLFSLLLFFIAGTSIVLSLIVIGSIVSGLSTELSGQWTDVIRVCMGVLTGVVSGINLFAIIKNVRFKKTGNGDLNGS